jgi:hypothetical protein
MPGAGTLEDFKNAVHVKAPKDLMHMLSGFRHFAPAFVYVALQCWRGNAA